MERVSCVILTRTRSCVHARRVCLEGRQENNEVPWYRIDELKTPEKLVLVVNRFAAMRQPAAELFEGLETRGAWSPEVLAKLPGSYLASLAQSYARVGLGSAELFSNIAAAAEAGASLAESDQQNLQWALGQAKA